MFGFRGFIRSAGAYFGVATGILIHGRVAIRDWLWLHWWKRREAVDDRSSILFFVSALAAFHLPNRVGECLMFVVQTLPLVRVRHIGQ